MSKKLLPLLCLLLPAQTLLAQGPGGMFSWQSASGGQPGNMQAYNMSQSLVMTRIKAGIHVDGSPYADSRWLTARLTMTDNSQIPPTPIRYDVLNKRLVLPASDIETDSMQLNDNALVSFVLEEPPTPGQPGRKRLFRRFMESPVPVQMSDYVEVLHEGKFTLLKHYEKVYVKAAPGNGMSQTNDRINDKTVYYVSRPGVAPIPVKLTLKGLQVGMPDLAVALKASQGAQSARTDTDWAMVLDKLDAK